MFSTFVIPILTPKIYITNKQIPNMYIYLTYIYPTYTPNIYTQHLYIRAYTNLSRSHPTHPHHPDSQFDAALMPRRYAEQQQHYHSDGVDFWWNDEGEIFYFDFFWYISLPCVAAIDMPSL